MFRRQTKPSSLMKLWFSIGVVLVLLASACSSVATSTIPPTPTPGTTGAELELQRDADVPDLPFPDNPDPNACGIPTPYGGSTAWVTGVYQGQMVEPTVLLYDSHERLHITGSVASGTPVKSSCTRAIQSSTSTTCSPTRRTDLKRAGCRRRSCNSVR